MDRLLRGLLAGADADGAVRVVAAVTTDACREAARRHETTPAASEALARATSAALLLATLTKGDERVTVQVLGDGPLRGLTIDASSAGEVRGFVTRPALAAAAAGEGGRARLGGLVGRGVVNVIRDLGLRERYQGASDLVSGEIDEDLEHHLTVSEQVESALTCEGVVDASGAVRAAGGILVQCLPGGDVAAVARARARIRGGLRAALVAGADDPAELLLRAGLDFEVLDERPVRFACPCSHERVSAALALCGEEELRSMLRDDGGAEVTCNFCGQRYNVDAAELHRLIGSLPRA